MSLSRVICRALQNEKPPYCESLPAPAKIPVTVVVDRRCQGRGCHPERNGKLTSMHGQTEVDEDIRQLCAQKHYERKYKFMEYVLCRSRAYQSSDWNSCATLGIRANVIKRCAEGNEGRKLLAASFEKARVLGINRSPTWLLSNKFDMRARSTESIKRSFCDKNPGVTGCEKTLTKKAHTSSKRAHESVP